MRKIWWIVILLAVSFFGLRTETWAAALEATMIMERMQTGENPQPVLVELRTDSNLSENGVEIVVGKAWTVAINTSSISIINDNLPSGVTPLPGSVSVVSINNQTIRLVGGDLQKNTLYGFYLTNGIGVNPRVGAADDYKWKIRTLVNGSMDAEKEIKVPVVGSDQILLMGRVGAKATDFQVEMTASPSATLNQNQETTLEITYGNLMQTAAKPLVIVGEWYLGTANQATPPMEVVDYVVGSATNAWNETLPVIDLINRRISWTIGSFPASTTDQKVRFSLRTNANYTGSLPINFKVKALLNGANVLSLSKEADLTYQYLPVITPTSTPTQMTAEPTSALTGSPAPSSAPIQTNNGKIENVEISTVEENKLVVKVKTSEVPNRLTLKWGKHQNSLNQKLVSLSTTNDAEMSLEGLESGTNYYFQVVAEFDKRIVTSELYTVKTASQSGLTEVDLPSLLITSNDNILLDARSGDQSYQTIVPVDTSYVVKINIDNPELVKQASLIVRNADILGITTVMGAEPSTLVTDLVYQGGKGFVGQLVSPKASGHYQVILKIVDIYGNVKEKLLMDLQVYRHIMVTDENNKPIEGARVLINRYDEVKRIYTVLQSRYQGFQNPVYSETNGEVRMVLPKGRYRLETKAVGYENSTVDLNLEYGNGEAVPKIWLKSKGFNVADQLVFYSSAATDTWKFMASNAEILLLSRRFMRLIVALNFGITIVLIFSWRKKRSARIQRTKQISYLKLFIRESGQVFFGGGQTLLLLVELLLTVNFGIRETWLGLALGLFNLGWWIILVLKSEVDYAKEVD